MTKEKAKTAIEILQAYIEGEVIQYKSLFDPDEWEDCVKPEFDFNGFEYRIKPNKLRCMTNKMNQSTKDSNKKFKGELTNLLNRYGYDNTCDTPDYILADYIGKCLENYCAVIQLNIAWHTGWKRLGEEVE